MVQRILLFMLILTLSTPVLFAQDADATKAAGEAAEAIADDAGKAAPMDPTANAPKTEGATGTEAAPQGGMRGLIQLVPIIAIFLIFYFVFIRPTQKQQKTLQKKIAELHKGDKVVTAGGVFGEYVGDKDNGKIAIVKVGEGTKLEVVKSTFQHVIPKGEDTAESLENTGQPS